MIFGSKNDNEIDITDIYKYLGVIFSKSGSFLKAKTHIVQQANKAMFFTPNSYTKNLNPPPFDLHLKLFDHTDTDLRE